VLNTHVQFIDIKLVPLEVTAKRDWTYLGVLGDGREIPRGH